MGKVYKAAAAPSSVVVIVDGASKTHHQIIYEHDHEEGLNLK